MLLNVWMSVIKEINKMAENKAHEKNYKGKKSIYRLWNRIGNENFGEVYGLLI